MADSKRTNRFQENWPIWLLAVVAVAVVVTLINRHEAPSQDETALVNESDNADENTETQEATAPEAPASLPPAAVPSSSPDSSPSQTAQNSQMKKLYSIQVHSFKDQTKAQKSVDDLKKAGYTPFLLRRDLKEKGIWYRVCVGEFESRQEANIKLAELRQKYKDSFVISR